MGTRSRLRVEQKVDKKKVKVLDAFELFVYQKERQGKSKEYVRDLRNAFKQFWYFTEFEDDEGFESISRDLILEWVEDMQVNESERTGELLSIASINSYLMQVRTFLYWSMGLDEKNGNEDINYIKCPFKVTLVKGQRTPPKAYTDDEVAALLKKPVKTCQNPVEWRQWAICNWVMGTGNRCGTFTNIKVKDLDLKAGECVLTHTKNKQASIAVLSDGLVQVMKEYMQTCKAYSEKDYHTLENYQNSYVFPSYTLEKLTTSAQRQAQESYARRRGVERSDIHGLRHTFAYHFARTRPKDVLVLQKIMGHSDVRTTQLYFDLTNDDIKRLTADFNPLDDFKDSRSKSRKFRAK